MKQITLKLSVSESAERLKQSLIAKGFSVFADIDHQANAVSVDLNLPASRTLIFGNPVAGTKLMQKDLTVSLDLPLRLAIIDKDQQTLLIYQDTAYYEQAYQLEGHPVLEKVATLFTTLGSELNE